MEDGSPATAGKTMPKPPKAPEKPLMPYMRYSRRVWDSVKSANNDSKLWEIGKVIGQQWRELDMDTKQRFIDEYEEEKVHYTEALRQYHASPAYQQYLNVKEKTTARIDEEAKWHAHAQGRTPHPEQHMSPAVSALRNSLISANPANGHGVARIDDDDHFALPVRVQQSYERFTRNQRLMLNVMSDSAVPDTRTVVTVTQLHDRKRQAVSLLTHQKKLNEELDSLDAKFESKRQCMEEASDKYEDVVNEMFHQATIEPTSDDFKAMIKNAELKLLDAYEKFKKLEENKTAKQECTTSSTAAVVERPAEQANAESTAEPETARTVIEPEESAVTPAAEDDATEPIVEEAHE